MSESKVSQRQPPSSSSQQMKMLEEIARKIEIKTPKFIVRGILLFCLHIPLFSCNTSFPEQQDHHVQLEEAFEKAEQLQYVRGTEKTIQYFDSMFNSIPNPGIGDRYRRFDFHRKQYFYNKRDYSQALATVDSMFLLLKDHVSIPKYASFYNLAHLFKGDILLEQGKYIEAFRYFFEGKKLAEKQADPVSMGEYSSRMGMVCYRQQKFADAASYFKQSIAEFREIKVSGYYFTRTQELLDNIGLSYMKSGKPDSAFFYYQKALIFIDKTKYLLPENPGYAESAKAVVYGNMGDYYYLKKDFAKGEEMFRKGISINSQKGKDNGDAQRQLAKLTELYLTTGRDDDVGTTLRQLRTSLEEHPNIVAEMSWNNLQSQYLAKTGRKDQALDYYQSYITLKDSAEKQSALFAALDIQREIKTLKSDNELLKLEERDKLSLIYLICAISVSLLLLVILFLIGKNYKKSKRNVIELSELNEQISEKHVDMMVAFSSVEKSHKENLQMMKVVAHDLRNPVVSILRYLEYMEDQTVLNTEQQRIMDMIRESGSNSLTLIDDLLHDNTRLKEHNVEVVQLDTVLQYCVNLLKLKAKEKQQQIELQSVPVSISIDREKIWRVMSNLIVNGIKFSPVGGTISVEMEREKNRVITLIRDNGIGIPESFREHIFDMFTDSQRPGTNGEESFGIGLAVCKSIVEAHHGKIWFESVEGKGTTFFVELPVG